MFQATLQPSKHNITIKLRGTVAGDSVQQLAELWNRIRSAALHDSVRVDVTGVSFLDEDGKRLLRTIRASGAELIAEDDLTMLFLDDMIQPQRTKLKRFAFR
jgi:anti-anti-sigma regulatory factor